MEENEAFIDDFSDTLRHRPPLVENDDEFVDDIASSLRIEIEDHRPPKRDEIRQVSWWSKFCSFRYFIFFATSGFLAVRLSLSLVEYEYVQLNPIFSLFSPKLPPFNNNTAIVAYIPEGHNKFIQQARHMLFSSWNFSCHHVPRGNRSSKTDLFFFAHHKILRRLPQSCTLLVINHTLDVTAMYHEPKDRCFIIEHTPSPDDYWHRNTFMFSLSFLGNPIYSRLLLSYGRLLRTDSDVVITPAFLTYRPNQLVVGRGGYMIHNFTIKRIHQLAHELKMTHQSIYNVGSTWFGPSQVKTR
jgi:hypothetical protein